MSDALSPLDVEEQQLKISKLQHDLRTAKKPFWRSVGFWLTFIPIVVGVSAFLWDVRQDNLSQEAKQEKARLEGQIRSAADTIDTLSTQMLELQNGRDEVVEQLTSANGDLDATTSQLQGARDELNRVTQEYEKVSSEVVCTLGENVIENIAWLGTGLLFFAEDLTYPAGVAKATEERYPNLFLELGGDAFDRRMDGYWELVWQDIPHFESIPDVAFATSLVVGFVDQYVSDVLGTNGFPDLLVGGVPRPSPLTLRVIIDHASQGLQDSGPAGNELARRLTEYELDPALDSVNLMFFPDPGKVDLRYARISEKEWDVVTLTESETRIVAEEIERLLDAHFQASREVIDLANAVLRGCPMR